MLDSLNASYTPPPQPNKSRPRRFHHGWCTAAIRAFTAAELYLDKRFSTLAEAAEACGSNVQYVRAAIVLKQDDTAPMVVRMMVRELVLVGHVPLLAAANQARRRHRRRSASLSTRRWRAGGGGRPNSAPSSAGVWASARFGILRSRGDHRGPRSGVMTIDDRVTASDDVKRILNDTEDTKEIVASDDDNNDAE